MRERLALKVVVLSWVGVAAGCGGGGTSPVDAGPPGNMAACVPNLLTFAGNLDGQAVDFQISSGGALQNQAAPYTLTLSFAGGLGQFELLMMVPWAGSSPITSGTIKMPPGAPREGETICVGGGTFTQVDRTGGTPSQLSRSNWVIRAEMLSLGPTCPGTTLPGRLDLCLAESN